MYFVFQLGKMKNMKDLHFGKFFKLEHPIAICCDDRGILETSLTDELTKLAVDCQLNMDQISNLVQRSFEFPF